MCLFNFLKFKIRNYYCIRNSTQTYILSTTIVRMLYDHKILLSKTI